MIDKQKNHFSLEEVTVTDEVLVLQNNNLQFSINLTFSSKDCTQLYCPICKLDKKIRNIKVKGLCSKSIYNSHYTLTLTEDGNLMYLGKYTSSIVFNKSTELWHWYDQKDNKSIAVR